MEIMQNWLCWKASICKGNYNVEPFLHQLECLHPMSSHMELRNRKNQTEQNETKEEFNLRTWNYM